MKKMGCFAKIFLGLIGLIIIGSLLPDTKDKSQDEKSSRKQQYFKNRRFIKTSKANVRSGPGTSNDIVKTLSYGALVKILETKDGWCKINIDTEQAWISAKLLETAEEQNIRLAKEKAATEAKRAKENLDTYIAAINIVQQNLGIKLIDNVYVSGERATITVTNLWHIRNYQLRLQDAQVLWETWARICSPNNPDHARIELKDFRGNNVGGSSWVAGSVIKVNK